MTHILSRFTSLRCHNDITRDEIRVITPHMPNQKTSILILCSFVFSPMQINSFFSCLKPPKFWPYIVMWREIWISLITCNSSPFYPIESFHQKSWNSKTIIKFLLLLSWIYSAMQNLYIIYDVTIVFTWNEINTNKQVIYQPTFLPSFVTFDAFYFCVWLRTLSFCKEREEKP